MVFLFIAHLFILFTCLFIFLLIYLFVYFYFHLFVYLSLCLFVCLFVYSSLLSLFVGLFFYFIHLFFYLFIHLTKFHHYEIQIIYHLKLRNKINCNIKSKIILRNNCRELNNKKKLNQFIHLKECHIFNLWISNLPAYNKAVTSTYGKYARISKIIVTVQPQSTWNENKTWKKFKYY